MPYKPVATSDDYPERNQVRPGGWISKHQRRNLANLIGENLMGYLDEAAKLERINVELLVLRARIEELLVQRTEINLGKEDDDEGQPH